MIDEESNEDGIKQFDQLFTPSEEEPTKRTESSKKNENQQSPIRKQEKKPIDYFSMNEDELTNCKNKLKDDNNDLLKEINPSTNESEKEKEDDNGWDDEELEIQI